MVNWNQVFRIAKQIFVWWKKNKAQGQQQGQQGQQQSYPPPGQQVQHQQQGAWSQPPPQHHASGGYGANEGPATNADMMNAQNLQYVNLRNRAIQEGDMMARCFADSKSAYSAGNGAAAHDQSIAGKEHQRMKDVYNHQAAEWIFDQNNKTQPQGSIDLHGLYVAESIEFSEQYINSAKAAGLPSLRIIVGKGNHSASHVAKIKPAIESLMMRQHLTAHLDEHNAGVLIVQLQGQGVGGARSIGAGDLEENPNCIVM